MITRKELPTMTNVIPFPNQGKQGRFNLGPGTAPAAAEPTNPYVRPRKANVCYACGTEKPIPGEKYGVNCVKAGRDNPFVQCRFFEECSTVRKRQFIGQQFFVCPRHKEKTP